jgi:hypothetical protein
MIVLVYPPYFVRQERFSFDMAWCPSWQLGFKELQEGPNALDFTHLAKKFTGMGNLKLQAKSFASKILIKSYDTWVSRKSSFFCFTLIRPGD